MQRVGLLLRPQKGCEAKSIMTMALLYPYFNLDRAGTSQLVDLSKGTQVDRRCARTLRPSASGAHRSELLLKPETLFTEDSCTVIITSPVSSDLMEIAGFFFYPVSHSLLWMGPGLALG